MTNIELREVNEPMIKRYPWLKTCPTCGARRDQPCRDVSASYLRGRSLMHPHRDRHKGAE